MPLHVVVCADRNPRAARIVAGLLEGQPDLQVERCSGCHGHCHQADQADVVVLTVGLPDMRDLTDLERTLRLHSHAPVIVLSLYEDAQLASRLCLQGAAALLALDQAVAKLPRMIRQLAQAHAGPAPA